MKYSTLLVLLATTIAANAMYDPSTGRWISRDPIGENGGWNLYAYCGNDPINKVDPSGLEDQTLYPPGTELDKQAALFGPAGFYSFGAHGNEDSTVLNQRTWLAKYSSYLHPLDATAVAKKIQADPKWKAGTPVIETVCNGGSGDAKSQAAGISKILNSDVYAADGPIWFVNGINGKPLKVFIAPADPANPKQPDKSKIMPWTKFSPDGTIIKVTTPFGYDP